MRNKCIGQYYQTPNNTSGHLGFEALSKEPLEDKPMGTVKDWEVRTKDSRYAAVGFTNCGKPVLAHVCILNGWRTDFVSRSFMTP